MSGLKASLYLIRHGETDWNVEGRLQGTMDIDLNARGREQAARNGKVLAGLFAAEGLAEADFDWVASPLRRARDTMEIVRGRMGLDPSRYRADPVLREVSFGDWEGSTLPEVKVSDPHGHAARKADKWAYVPSRGESYEMLSARLRPWLFGLTRDTVCVAHGGITRVVRGMLEDIPTAAIPVEIIPQDRIYVWRDGRAEWI